MSNSDSFISEVSEEVRRDKLYDILRRYGWLIILAILLLVGAAAAVEWSKSHSRAAAEAAGDALRTALSESDPAARAEKLAVVAGAHPDAAPLIRMAEAGGRIQAGQTEEAGATLAALAEDGGTPELFRALASLQRLMLLGPTMDVNERRATIEALAGQDTPFQPLALEQRALLSLESGDRPAAIADLQAILTTPNAPEQLVARTRQLLVASGGTLPGITVPEVPADGAASGG